MLTLNRGQDSKTVMYSTRGQAFNWCLINNWSYLVVPRGLTVDLCTQDIDGWLFKRMSIRNDLVFGNLGDLSESNITSDCGALLT